MGGKKKDPRNKVYKKLSVVRDLTTGRRSKRVSLLEGNIVAKFFDRHSSAQTSRFNKELQILKRLHDCPFVPKLLHVNYDKQIVYMTRCGANVPLTLPIKQQVEAYLKELATKWHVFRIKGTRVCTSADDVFHANICVDERGKVFLIDFGSNLWQIHDKNAERLLAAFQPLRRR
jgi:hypothetical protein